MRQSLDEVMPVPTKRRRVLFLWIFPSLLLLSGIAGAGYLLFGPVSEVAPVPPSPTLPENLVVSITQTAGAIPKTDASIALLPTVVTPSSTKLQHQRTNHTLSEVTSSKKRLFNQPIENTAKEYNNKISESGTEEYSNSLSSELLSEKPSTPATIIPVTPGTLLHPVVPRTEVLQSRYTLLDIAPVIPSSRHPWELALLSGVGYRFSNQQTGVNAGFQFGTKLSKRWWLVSGYLYDLRKSTVYLSVPLFSSNIDPTKANQVVTELSKDGGPYVLSAYSLNTQAAEKYLSGSPIYQHTHQFYIGSRFQILPRLEWQSTIGLGLSNHPVTGVQGQPVVQWNNQLQWKFTPRVRIYAGWQQPMNYAFFENDLKKLPVGEVSMGLQWSIFAP